MKCIIDTNVPLKAANTSPQDEIDRLCSSRCLSFLIKIMESDDIVVLDSGREILKEYGKNINTHAEPNIASEFLKWIYRKILLEEIEMYAITKTGHTYAEFPQALDLQTFDRSDRKFVALALAHPGHPRIYNGSDTDWWMFKDALEREGVHVVFLCEEYMKSKCKG